MTDGVPESDWKVFRELRELALDRFCRRVLDEVEDIRTDASNTHHARYLRVYRLLQERDEALALAFNDPRRSQMLLPGRGSGAPGVSGDGRRERHAAGTVSRRGSRAAGIRSSSAPDSRQLAMNSWKTSA